MTDRRARILDLVAASYIRSAHPVPSSRIAERMALSSATVRNEFGALADEGLLQQAHASSGRIPTALGFRRYAARFLPPRPLSPSGRARLLERLHAQPGDTLLDQLATAAADLSGYAVLVTLPAQDHLHAVEIHLSLLASRTLLAVVVLENGLVRQLRVPLDPAPHDDVLDDAERNLRQLTMPLREVPAALSRLAADTEPELARTLSAIAAAWPDVTPRQRAQAGLRQLFDEPEARDADFVRLVVEHIEAPSAPRAAPASTSGRVPHDAPDADDASVFADAPSTVELRLDDSVARVRSGVPLGSGVATLTLIGPSRMRYWAAVRVAGGISAAFIDHGAEA